MRTVRLLVEEASGDLIELPWPPEWEDWKIHLVISADTYECVPHGGRERATKKSTKTIRLVGPDRAEWIDDQEVEAKYEEFKQSPIFLDDIQRVVYLNGHPERGFSGERYRMLKTILERGGTVHQEVAEVAMYGDGQEVTQRLDKNLSRTREVLKRHIPDVTLNSRNHSIALSYPEFIAVFRRSARPCPKDV